MTGPLFIMSALTMFFFLGGMEVGVVFVSQVIYGKSATIFAVEIDFFLLFFDNFSRNR